MAIVQISKIQQRSGNIVDLPQLDEAEFGFASDAKKLYIGKESPAENIEVLTSYSNIAFSQIDGAVGNLDISAITIEDGQVLTYDGNNWTNRGGNAGGLITLGDVSNVKLDGGASGFILETDGAGNLSWTPKGVIIAFIENATQANPCVITTTEDNFFVDGAQITITNVPGMTQLNGNTYYANVLTSNTISLYSDSALTTGVNSTAFGAFPYTTATATTASNDQVTVGNATPFTVNDPVVFLGDTDTSNSNIVVGQTYYVKTKDTAAPNTWITLSSTVGGATLALGDATFTANVYTSGGRIVSAIGSGTPIVSVGGSNQAVQFNNGTGGLGGDSDFTWNSVTNLLTINGNANVGNINVSSAVIASTLTSNVATGTAPLTVSSTTRVSNLNVAYSNVSDFEVVTAQTTGTFFPIFVNSSATGNRALGANSNLGFNAATGNLSATILNANGNIIGGNLTTAGVLSVTGNANVGNLGTAGLIVATGNVTGGNLVTSGVVSATGNVTAGNLVTSGRANINNLSITGTVTGNLIPNADVTFDLGNSTNKWNNLHLAGNTIYLGTVTLTDASGALETAKLSITGNANVGNLGTSGLIVATGNITGGNLVTTGIISVTGNANVGNINVSGNGTFTGNITASSGNINASGINVSTINIDNLSTPLAPSGTVSSSGGTVLTGNYYFRIVAVDSFGRTTLAGSESTALVATTNSSQIALTWAAVSLAASYRIYWTTSSGVYTNGYWISTTNSYTMSSMTGSTVGSLPTTDTTGYANIAGNADIGGALVVAGNTTAGNLTTAGQLVATGNITGGNLITSGLASVTGNITGGNLITAGVLQVTGNANVGNFISTGNANISGNVTGNILITENDLRVGNVASDEWGRMRFVTQSIIYGMTFNGLGATAITNEVSSENQALLLGDSTGIGNIFGISYRSGGNSVPTSGLESGWDAKLLLDASGNLLAAGKITATGSLIGTNVIASGYLSAVGNVSGANLVTTGVLSVTGNANVGNIGATTAVLSTITSGSNTTAGSIFGTWTLTGGDSGNSLIVANGNIYTSGIRTDNYYFANGVPLSLEGTYSNSNVANYLPIYNGNIAAGNVSVTANIQTNRLTATSNVTAGNVVSSGVASITGTITGGNLSTAGNLTASGTSNLATVNISGSTTTNRLFSNVDINFGNVTSDQYGRLRYSHVSSLYGFTFDSTGVGILTNEEATQNQALVLGDSSGTGTLFGVSTLASGGANPTTGNESGWTPQLNLDGNGNLTIAGRVNAPNATIGNITTTFLTSGANTTSGAMRGTWTVTGGASGNSLIVANGNIYTSGIRTDNYYYANGVAISFVGAYSNANVAAYLPVYNGGAAFDAATANSLSVVTFGVQNATVTTGLTVSNVTTGANTTAGTITGTWTIDGGSSGNSLIVTNGNLVFSGAGFGIRTDNYYYGNGVAINFNGTYTNSNVQSYLSVFNGNVGNVGSSTVFNGRTLSTGANTTTGSITGNWALTAGSRLIATYADLAEYYNADQNYAPGTVLEFGGVNEVTLAKDGTTRVAGVVSSEPAYAMNAKCQGEYPTAIALQGRVPTKVRGNIKKGDMMISAGDGYARPSSNPIMGSVIGKALVDFNGVEGVIEVAIGRL